jgi:hypothetical protein
VHRVPRWAGQETLQGQRLVTWDSLEGYALADRASPRRTLGGGRLIQRPIPTYRRRLEHTATSQEQSHPPSAAASPFPVGLVEASIKLDEGPARTEVLSWPPARPLENPRGASGGFHQGGS